MPCYLLVRCENDSTLVASKKGIVCAVMQDWRQFGSKEKPPFVTKIYVPDKDMLDLLYLTDSSITSFRAKIIDFDSMPEPLPRVSGTMSRSFFSRRVGQRLHNEYNSVRYSDFIDYEVVNV